MIPFKKKILVTSALPYANGPIHIGHLVEYIQTDIFVRFLRLIGEDVIYCCADDTHGAPIEIKASQLGITPEQLIEKVHREHFADFQRFHIKFDSYYTTNSPENKHFSDHFFLTLQKNGFIYKKTIEQTYCPKCKRVLPDRYVKGTCPKCGAEDQYGDVCEKCNSAYKTVDLIDPYCVICKSTPQRKESEHYFFKLSTFSDKLDAWLTGNKNLQPEIVNFIRNWIKDGLEDWDITRDGPYFGFKIPGEENKYYYVWLDAPIGYIASTENYCKQHGLKAEDYWTGDKAEIIHFIGKDIIYFHFLFWPATLMGIGFNLPKDIIVHGFLTQKEEKMSKSRGSLFTAEDYLKIYNPEHLRFYYAKGLSKKLSDINLEWDDFSDTINNELVANIANFCYRVLSFIQKNYEGKITEIAENDALIKQFNEGTERIKKLYREYNFREAVREILALGAIGNKYMQDEQPWKKSKEEAAPVLGLCANLARNLSILISPILPVFSEKIQAQLGEQNLRWEDINFNFTGSVRNAEIVMHKFEKKEAEVFPALLKVAKIISVEPHPDAEKLVVLKIDLGTEHRQIVAGIRKFYALDDLPGKNIVIVANLKPAKLRGIESKGMLLAAVSEDQETLALVEAPKSSPGDVVCVDGKKPNESAIKYEEFSKLVMVTKGKKILLDGKPLRTEKEEVSADIADGMRIY